MKTLQESIIFHAKSFVGQEEISGNMGFEDPDFDEKMREVGFQDTWAWCVLFCELCWKLAYKDHRKKTIVIIDKTFTAGAVRTFKHFKEKGWTSKKPEIGSIAIWKKFKDGKGTSQGHAAIVEAFDDDTITTIDGNSNEGGSREGVKVVDGKVRPLNFNSTKGLVLIGFIHPK